MKTTKDRLAAEQAILISNIQTGLTDYPHVILQKTPEEFLTILRQMIQRNGPGHSYADFYWARLSQEERSKLTASFPPSRKTLWTNLITSLNIGHDDLYFTLEDDEFLFMLHHLTCGEHLFSSFYFTKFPCTIWGNYNLAWPILFKDQETISAYPETLTQGGI